MRLSPEEAQAIHNTALRIYGAGTHVRLFGSRVDDQLRGGDLDLYLEIDDQSDHLLDKKVQFIKELWEQIGPQKIDVVTRRRSQPLKGIHKVAIERGVEL